jgi:hypothetical protein
MFLKLQAASTNLLPYITVQFCECEALTLLRHPYLGSFYLEPEDIKNMSGGHLELWQGKRGPVNQNWAQTDWQ